MCHIGIRSIPFGRTSLLLSPQKDPVDTVVFRQSGCVTNLTTRSSPEYQVPSV